MTPERAERQKLHDTLATAIKEGSGDESEITLRQLTTLLADKELAKTLNRLSYLSQYAYRDTMSEEDYLLDQSTVLKQELAELRSQEDCATRTAFIERFGIDAKENKLLRHTLSGGWKIEGKIPVSVTIDEAALPSIRKALPTGVAEGCLRVKHTLIAKEYNSLGRKEQLIMDEAITRKPGKPTIKIIPPKGD